MNTISQRTGLEEPISPKGTETIFKILRKRTHHLLEEPISPKGTETLSVNSVRAAHAVIRRTDIPEGDGNGFFSGRLSGPN